MQPEARQRTAGAPRRNIAFLLLLAWFGWCSMLLLNALGEYVFGMHGKRAERAEMEMLLGLFVGAGSYVLSAQALLWHVLRFLGFRVRLEDTRRAAIPPNAPHARPPYSVRQAEPAVQTITVEGVTVRR